MYDPCQVAEKVKNDLDAFKDWLRETSHRLWPTEANLCWSFNPPNLVRFFQVWQFGRRNVTLSMVVFFRDPWIGWCIETAHLVKGIVACQASPRLVLEFNIVEAQRNSSKQFSKSQAKVHTGFKWHEPSKDAFKLSTGDHNLVYNGIMHFFEKMCLAEVVRFSVKPQFFFRNYLLPK